MQLINLPAGVTSAPSVTRKFGLLLDMLTGIGNLMEQTRPQKKGGDNVAQGDFTKQEADATVEAVMELFKALSKSKQADFFGHLNDILLFVDAAKQNAPDETASETPSTEG